MVPIRQLDHGRWDPDHALNAGVVVGGIALVSTGGQRGERGGEGYRGCGKYRLVGECSTDTAKGTLPTRLG